MKNLLLFFIVVLLISSCTTNQQESNEYARIADSIRVADSIAMIEISIPDTWKISHYVDEFGEPTKQRFITNSKIILGTFSNSATENSDLVVKFLIDNPESISIQLFEYAGNNPVKKGIEEGYKIKIKPENSEPVVLEARNFSDRLSLNKANSKKLSDILLKGGRLLFSIIEVTEYSSASYKFEIPNAQGYDKILSELIK
jgi:hypothetical protein